MGQEGGAGTGELAQGVKRLLNKQQDSSSDPESLDKSQKWW